MGHYNAMVPETIKFTFTDDPKKSVVGQGTGTDGVVRFLDINPAITPMPFVIDLVTASGRIFLPFMAIGWDTAPNLEAAAALITHYKPVHLYMFIRRALFAEVAPRLAALSMVETWKVYFED